MKEKTENQSKNIEKFPNLSNVEREDQDANEIGPLVTEMLTQRGKEKIAFDGYLFTFDKESKTEDDLKFWRCERVGSRRFGSQSCKARLYTKRGRVVKHVNTHNHEASVAKIEMAILKAKIKKRAAETSDSCSVVVNECLKEITATNLPSLPNMSSLRKTIERQRHLLRNSTSPKKADSPSPDPYKADNPNADYYRSYVPQLCEAELQEEIMEDTLDGMDLQELHDQLSSQMGDNSLVAVHEASVISDNNSNIDASVIKITTERGKVKMAHNGFLYIFDKQSRVDDELTFWKCERMGRCKARVYIKDGKITKQVNSHSHEPSASSVEVALVKSNIKKRAAETLESFDVVVNECLTNVSSECLASIPNMAALKKTIERKRHSILSNSSTLSPENDCKSDLDALKIENSFSFNQNEFNCNDALAHYNELLAGVEPSIDELRESGSIERGSNSNDLRSSEAQANALHSSDFSTNESDTENLLLNRIRSGDFRLDDLGSGRSSDFSTNENDSENLLNRIRSDDFRLNDLGSTNLDTNEIETSALPILTQRGRRKIAYNGFLYIYDKDSRTDNSLQFWRCEKRGHCKARLYVRDGKVVKQVNDHLHEASPAKVEVALVKMNIKQRAAETLEPTNVVLNECLNDLSPASLAAIPSTSTLRKTIERKRHSLRNVTENVSLSEGLQSNFTPQLCETEIKVEQIEENDFQDVDLQEHLRELDHEYDNYNNKNNSEMEETEKIKCNLCEFQCNFEESLKDHIKQVHFIELPTSTKSVDGENLNSSFGSTSISDTGSSVLGSHPTIEILTQRGKEKIACNGFLYTFDKESTADKNVKFWRCDRIGRCKARIATKNGRVIKEVNKHLHEPSATDVEIALVKTNILKRAMETLEPTNIILKECLTDISDASLACIPNVSSLKRTIERKRNGANAIPSNCTADLEKLKIPESYTRYTPESNIEENFLLCDSGPSPNRILIFGRETWLPHLVSSDIWYVENMLDVINISPKCFSHMFVIMVKHNEGVYPVIYALLPNNQYSTYISMFKLLCHKEPKLNPSTVICNFKPMMHQVIREIFPSVQIKGCFFHLAENMQSQIASLNITNFYNTDPDFALKAKMIIALAYVPMDKINYYIDALALELPPALLSVLKWFQDTFVGQKDSGVTPLFCPDSWNLYQRTINGEERVSSYADVAVKQLKYELGKKHPTIWKLILELCKMQKNRDKLYKLLESGQKPPHQMKKCKEADCKIEKLVSQFENIDANEYLRGIAHNYQMKS